MSHRGVPVVAGGVGARGTTKGARRFEVHDYGPNFIQNNDDTCVPAAVSNATASLFSNDAGADVHNYFKEHVPNSPLSNNFSYLFISFLFR